MNIGVIGYGRHSSARLYPAFQLAGANITCVLTRSAASARAACAALRAERSYHDLDTMLAREQLDAVVICVDPEQQAPLTTRCVEAGVPVFVEKPLGMSGTQAAQVAAIAEQHNVTVMVGFMKRFAPVYQRLAEFVADNERMGQLLTVDAMFSFPPWTTELRVDSFLQQGAIHMIDILVATFGAATIEAGHSNSHRSDIGLAYTLRFADAALAAVTLSATMARAGTNERVTAVGTKAWVSAENLTSVRFRHDGLAEATEESWESVEDFAAICHSDDPQRAAQALELCKQGFYGEARHFLECVAGGKVPQAAAIENVTTMRLCDGLIDSVRPIV